MVTDEQLRVGAEPGRSREEGLYSRDTRYLSRYHWRLAGAGRPLLQHSERLDSYHQHVALMDGPSQAVGLRRTLTVKPRGFLDELELENNTLTEQRAALTLTMGADFADLFAARGWSATPTTPVDAQVTPGGEGVTFEHVASDGVRQSITLEFSTAPSSLTPERATIDLTLAPGETHQLTVAASISDPLATTGRSVTYAEWLSRVDVTRVPPRHQPALRRALTDLRGLLLFEDGGPIAAAGIPWFVTAFGRDSLITALMLLEDYPEVARGTLRFLAARQGTEFNAKRAEAPGKILHEVRNGELSRTGVVPFERYYGTIDATPLFVMLLGACLERGDVELIRELRSNLDAAVTYLLSYADLDGDGFLEFAGAAPGEGLTVQSWKDSHDSLSHANGTLASGAIAVSEVQGYAYAAYLAAANCYEALGEGERARELVERAATLRADFHRAFWLPELGTYALALDHDKRPLAVLNSDAGQLLFTGIVPESAAGTVVATLMSPEMFSGWGVRTLGTTERRYNPLSYHNGSVWPHDTALIAAGMRRYGFLQEALVLRDALFDLASAQPDLRPPELVAGYERGTLPPVPYPAACKPQAWSSAALVSMSGWRLPVEAVRKPPR